MDAFFFRFGDRKGKTWSSPGYFYPNFSGSKITVKNMCPAIFEPNEDWSNQRLRAWIAGVKKVCESKKALSMLLGL